MYNRYVNGAADDVFFVIVIADFQKMVECGNCCQGFELHERFNRNTIASILAGVVV